MKLARAVTPNSAVHFSGNISRSTENCANCHDPHGSAQPALLKIRPPFLCQTCHEGAGHPSIVNTPKGLPGGGSPSAYLLVGGCVNCHSQVHGSNSPSGRAFMR